jgi:hypothetical protein
VPVIAVAMDGSPATASPTPTPPAVAPASGAAGSERVPESTIGNLVRQWQSQLQLCYTDFGLKENHDLAGTVTVRVSIRSTGEVAAVEIPQHHWSGAAGVAPVEACIRTKVRSWLFPAASLGSSHEFRLIFTQ